VVRHIGVLQERVILLTVLIEKVSRVNLEDRLEVDVLEDGFVRVVLHYGYMQGPNIPSDLQRLNEHGIQLDLASISYFIGQVDMLAGRKRSGMMVLRDRLFVWMARNTRDMTSSYHIPAGQVMSVGLQVGI